MGSQVRALELIRALGTTGHEIHLASEGRADDQTIGWSAADIAAVKALGVREVHIHKSLIDDVVGWYVRRRERRKGKVREMGSWGFTPPLRTRWFACLVGRLEPDLLFMNYSISDPMVEAAGFDRAKCVLETHDLVLLNKRMQSRLQLRLPPRPYSTRNVDPEILELDWYRHHETDVSDEEAETCARYGLSLSISAREATRIKAHGGNVVHLPMSMSCGREGNSYDGGAILAAGLNGFNVQGYLWFAAKVLPLLRVNEPGFRLDVTGALSDHIAGQPGVVPHGVVPDLGGIYLQSRFAICPVFGGTGQQVKIVEAMAWGVPVVALAEPALESPIVHGENGLICSDHREFAEACLSLWRDEPLRRRLGNAARETVKRDLLSSRYATRVRDCLEKTFPWL